MNHAQPGNVVGCACDCVLIRMRMMHTSDSDPEVPKDSTVQGGAGASVLKCSHAVGSRRGQHSAILSPFISSVSDISTPYFYQCPDYQLTALRQLTALSEDLQRPPNPIVQCTLPVGLIPPGAAQNLH